MGRHKKGARIWEREARYEIVNGKKVLTHKPAYIIIDGKKQTTLTGCKSMAEANQLLEQYNIEKYGNRDRPKGKLSHEMLIGDAIALYLTLREEAIKKKHQGFKLNEHYSHIAHINAYWGDMYVDDIKLSTVEKYCKLSTNAQARNRMILLRGIVNHAVKEKALRLFHNEIDYNIPEPNAGRTDTYTMEELIAVYKAAMRKRHRVTVHRTDKKTGEWKEYGTHDSFFSTRHVAKFTLVAFATCTRAGRVCRASFYDEPGLPWIDLDEGIFWRAFKKESVAKNKRADPVQLHPRLIRILKRWRDGDGKFPPTRYLVEYQGRWVKDCSGAFDRILDAVLPAERAECLNRHILKHTSVTMLAKAGVPIEQIADYSSTSPDELRRTYKHLFAGTGKELRGALDSNPEQAKANRAARAKAKAAAEAAKLPVENDAERAA